jgi:hypothetical protein
MRDSSVMTQTNVHSVFDNAEQRGSDKGHCVARIVGFDLDGYPCLQLESGSSQPAESLIPITGDLLNQWVVAVPLAGSERTMLVVGRLQKPGANMQPPIIEENGKLTIQAGRELQLRCGDASINLKSTGKVTIRGKYVLTRSSGVNAVKGAVVEIN